MANLQQSNDPRDSKIIGLIGLGAMGLLYARKLSAAGWKIVAADRAENFERCKELLSNTTVEVVKDGHLVARQADYTIYSVEAAALNAVVSTYGPSTKVGAAVGGQTSTKAPEIKAFEEYLAPDVEIISIHSMHGPNVDPKGQPLVIIQHRAKDETRLWIEQALSVLESKIVYLTAAKHDLITADVQAVTHMAFLSMGSAWRANNQYPWIDDRLSGGLENAKINIALRIYSNRSHVYSGLAITNPMAHVQTLQYAKSVTDLFKMMIKGEDEAFRNRIYAARDFVFEKVFREPEHSLLLPPELIGKFSLSREKSLIDRSPNSQLSILGIVDCWYQSKIIPYDHVICSTPLFRILLGVTEFLFTTPSLLDRCIEDGLGLQSYRGDDMEFVVCTREWAKVVSQGDFAGYQRMFDETRDYFAHMLPDATKIGNEMIEAINELLGPSLDKRS